MALLAELRTQEDRVIVEVHPRLDAAGRQTSAVLADRGAAELAGRCVELRRRMQRLEQSAAAMEARNEVFRLERLEKRLALRKWKAPADQERLAALPRFKQAVLAMETLAQQIGELELEALLAVYGKGPFDPSRLSSQWQTSAAAWKELLLTLYALRFKHPETITLGIYSPYPVRLFALAAGYHALAVKAGAAVEAARFTRQRTGWDQGVVIEREPVQQPEKYLSEPRAEVIGLALALSGRLVYPRYEAERGLHVFTQMKKEEKCLVQTSEAALSAYQPPPGIHRLGNIGHHDRRRIYQHDEGLVEDLLLKRKWPWSGRQLEDAMATAIEERLMAEAMALVD